MNQRLNIEKGHGEAGTAKNKYKQQKMGCMNRRNSMLQYCQ